MKNGSTPPRENFNSNNRSVFFKNWLKKLSSHAVLMGMVVSIFSIGFSASASAAMLTNTGVVPTSTNAGASTNVVISFTAMNNIPADGKIKVTFPGGFDISQIQSVDVFSSLDGTFMTSLDGQTLTISRTGAATAQSGTKTITIANNKIKNPIMAGQSGNYSITTTDSTDSIIDTDPAVPGSNIMGMVGTFMNASVVPSSLVASANSNVVVSFTPSNNIPADGKIKIIFPTGFDISSVTSSDITSSLNGSLTVSTNGQTLTLVRSGGATSQSGSQTININNNKVKNPSFTGLTGTYTITTVSINDIIVDTNSAVPGNNISSAGSLTNVSVVPGSLATSANSNVVISFTATNNIPADGKIKITFPTGFDISTVTSSDITSSLDGSFTPSISGQTLTLTRGGSSTAQNGSRTITIGNNKVKNPSVAGLTGTYTVSTTNSNDVVIDTTSSVPGNTLLTAGSITNATIVPSSLNAGVNSNVVISFTATNNVPANGKIKITFPTGFDISSVISADITSSFDGSFTSSTSGQTLTITRGGSSTAQSGARTITIGNNKVKNPSATGLTGTYTIATTNNNDAVIDINSSVPGNTIATAGSLTNVTIVPTSLNAGISSNVVISFTSTNNVPANGKIKITFPAGFDISSVTSSDITSSFDGGFSASVNGQTLTITRTGSGTAQNGTKTITINNNKVKNPVTTGLTGTYSLTTTTNTDTVVDNNNSITGNTITAEVYCAGYKDVQPNDADCEAFRYVQSIGAITGNDDKTLNANGLLQRDQVAKIVLETFKNFDKSVDYCKNSNPFPDVTKLDWAFQYVCKGVSDKIITGYLTGADTGYYRPSRSVNRAEFSALLLRNLKNDTMPSNSSTSYNDVPTNSWYSGYAKYFKDNNLLTGLNFSATQSVSRREVAQIIYKLHLLGKI